MENSVNKAYNGTDGQSNMWLNRGALAKSMSNGGTATQEHRLKRCQLRDEQSSWNPCDEQKIPPKLPPPSIYCHLRQRAKESNDKDEIAGGPSLRGSATDGSFEHGLCSP